MNWVKCAVMLLTLGLSGCGGPNEPSNPGPEGHIAFVSTQDGNTDIYVVDLDAGAVHRLTTDPAVDAEPAWSPDGTRLAFTSYHDGVAGIYVMNADGSGVSRLVPPDASTAYDYDPAWSPDGSTIAFSRDGSITTLSLATGQLTQLTGPPDHSTIGDCLYDDAPAWSPDEASIAFVRGLCAAPMGGTVGHVYRMDADGSDVRLVDESDRTTTDSPAWSSTGALAFAENYQNFRRWLDIGMNSFPWVGNRRDLQARDPAWAPDGDWLAFVANADDVFGPGELYVVNPDGSDLQTLDVGLTAESPAWTR